MNFFNHSMKQTNHPTPAGAFAYHHQNGFFPLIKQPNLDPAFYPPFPGQARMSPERQQLSNNSNSPLRSASTSSPQDAGGRGSGRRKSGLDIMEDEEDWSHLPESERALAKLDKRRGQNKIAQRAFRARTRLNKAQVSPPLYEQC